MEQMAKTCPHGVQLSDGVGIIEKVLDSAAISPESLQKRREPSVLRRRNVPLRSPYHHHARSSADAVDSHHAWIDGLEQLGAPADESERRSDVYGRTAGCESSDMLVPVGRIGGDAPNGLLDRLRMIH